MKAPGTEEKKPFGALMVCRCTCSGTHSTWQERQFFIAFPPTFNVVTHISEYVRLHFLHKYRAGDFGWNLQNFSPRSSAAPAGAEMNSVEPVSDSDAGVGSAGACARPESFNAGTGATTAAAIGIGAATGTAAAMGKGAAMGTAAATGRVGATGIGRGAAVRISAGGGGTPGGAVLAGADSSP